MFRLNRKIKDRCLNNDLLGRDIGKIEYEVQNKLNELFREIEDQEKEKWVI